MAPAELARTAYTVECFLNALRLDDGRARTEIEAWLVKWLSNSHNTAGSAVYHDGSIFCSDGRRVVHSFATPTASRQHAVWCDRRKLSEIDAASYAGSGQLVMLGTTGLLLSLPGSGNAALPRKDQRSSNNNNNNNNNNNG